MRKEETTCDAQEIWSAIRYLDPDENRSPRNAIAAIIVIALTLVICMILVEIRLRGL